MLAPWREYLYGHLLGSPAIVRSIFALLQYDSVGMVFPQHFFPLRNHLKWGPNFKAAEAILNRMGVDLPHDVLLECPSGSMFWCRTSALRPLLSLELQFEDFDEEHGQIDGTLAHAIERVFLYTLEAYGFTWAKVARRDLYPLPQTIIPVQSTFDIKSGMALVHRVLLGKSRIEGSV
jgi:lipopolysaccharide biosynthesis protein